jgi:hypothetical protein
LIQLADLCLDDLWIAARRFLQLFDFILERLDRLSRLIQFILSF